MLHWQTLGSRTKTKPCQWMPGKVRWCGLGMAVGSVRRTVSCVVARQLLGSGSIFFNLRCPERSLLTSLCFENVFGIQSSTFGWGAHSRGFKRDSFRSDSSVCASTAHVRVESLAQYTALNPFFGS
jgi:hypothetical protein